jgi:hypothetical protein
MDKIKKALRLGDPVYKHDDDFDAAIQRMRREQEQEMKRIEYESQRRMNAAQNAIQNSPYQQQEKYGYGWNDPRGMMNARPISREEALVDSLAETNQVMKRLHEKIDRTEKKVEMLTGFYTWITEVYPEIAAQHKAMRDLYEAANSGETQPEKEA